MKTLKIALVGAALTGAWLMAPQAAKAAPSACDVVVGNLISNCGFELGDFTSWSMSANGVGSALNAGQVNLPNNPFNYAPNSGDWYAGLWGVATNMLGPQNAAQTGDVVNGQAGVSLLSQDLTANEVAGGVYGGSNILVTFTLGSDGSACTIPTTTNPPLGSDSNCGYTPEYITAFNEAHPSGPDEGQIDPSTHPFPTIGNTNFQIIWNGDLISSFTPLAVVDGMDNVLYTTYSFIGVSNGTGDILTFGAQNDLGWLTLDDVTAENVPEPASLALLGAGLAGVSLIRRRKKA